MVYTLNVLLFYYEVINRHLNSSALTGEGFFETLLWRDNCACELDLHMQRLQCSLMTFFHKNLEYLPTEDDIKVVVFKNTITSEARVRVTVFLVNGELELSMTAHPYCPVTGNVSVTTSSLFSPSPQRPLSGHKSTSYADYAVAYQEAKNSGFDEALLINTNGMVCEGATSNIFFFKQGELYTPALSSGCLPGIMRSLVISRCEASSISVTEGEFTKQDLLSAESVFITNSLRRVQQVETLDGVQFSTLPKHLLEAITD